MEKLQHEMNTPEITLLKAETVRLQLENRELKERCEILNVRLDYALSRLAEINQARPPAKATGRKYCSVPDLIEGENVQVEMDAQDNDAATFLAHVDTPKPPEPPFNGDRLAALIILAAALGLLSVACWTWARGYALLGIWLLAGAGTVVWAFWPMGKE